MDFIPLDLVKVGGPWAAFLSLLASVSFLLWKGHLIPGPMVDRAVAGYLETIKNLREELTFWRAAADKKDATIATQADQLQKMVSYSAVGTHALEDILKEARKRDTEVA